MMKPRYTEIISLLIKNYISSGIVPDIDTLHFIKSSYGTENADEISCLIDNGDDGGAILDLVSYPDFKLREEIESLIPASGLKLNEITSIENTFTSFPDKSFLIFSDRKIFLSENDSLFCHRRILQRLHLDISFCNITSIENPEKDTVLLSIRACLRKKRFITGTESSLFINDLILNCRELKDISNDELYYLINISARLLNFTEKSPYQIISEKKYFYESMVAESEEFSRLLSSYNMEFMMMKKIQPPLVPLEEARTMVKTIDRLTSIVYGITIPSVRNIII